MKKIILLIPFILIIFILIFNPFKSKELSLDDKLNDLGYTKEEIKIINELNNPSIILNYDYNTNIINIIKNKNFKEENIGSYIELSTLYNFSNDDIIYIVNNNYYDKKINYTNEVISLMKEKYFILDNLDRYLSYDSDSNEEKIKMVNSNRDKNFYKDVKKTDLSKEYLILVNKYNYLDSDYEPSNLVTINSKYGISSKLEKTTYEQYIKMYEDAKKEGLDLYIRSPYRSYKTQQGLYERYASQDGYNKADTYSARPGYSEHQTGLAFDVTSKSTTLGTFEGTSEFYWLKDNCYKYGFILRYPKGKEDITGYVYESWHYRYVGVEAAKVIHDEEITFEEYYEYYVK